MSGGVVRLQDLEGLGQLGTALEALHRVTTRGIAHVDDHLAVCSEQGGLLLTQPPIGAVRPGVDQSTDGLIGALLVSS